MKTTDWIYLPAGALLAFLASYATTTFAGPRAEPADSSTIAVEEALAHVERTLTALESGQAELAQRLAEAELTSGGSARSALGGVDAAVARWMESNAPGLAEHADAPTDAAQAPDGDAVELAINRILARDFADEDEAIAFWRELRDAGQLDAVLEKLEAVAEASPLDPALHLALAGAYVQKVFDVGPGPLQTLYNQKADAAYDATLELDERNWEARFGKALALSNWPSFLGKSGEAIHQFEVLLEQQVEAPVQPHFVNTYFFLGNMYQEAGDAERALAVWQRGLGVFPGDDRLTTQVATFAGDRTGGTW